MKKIPVLIFLVATVLVSYGQKADYSSRFEKMVAQEKKAHSYINQKIVALSGNDYDVKYNRCEWYVDPALYNISGAVTTYFTSNISALNQIVFDLANQLTVDSVIYHSLPMTYTQIAGDGLSIPLPTAVGLNVLDSITVYYHGVPVTTGFGSFNQDFHLSVPIIWTLSEAYGASDWWPCKNSLIDKIDSLDIIVTTPSAYRAASNGVLLAELTAGANKIYHWQSHYPIATYLVAIGVTNYSVYSHYVPLAVDSLEVLNYVYPEDLSTAQSLTPAIIPVIQLYDSLTIEYPFAQEKYGHAQFGWGGGMEHQTMSFVVAFDHELIAHECAHQWFGDKVTCGSWVDIWLNEGFATYMEALTEQYLYSSNWNNWKAGTIANITSQPYGSVMCDDTTDLNRIFDWRLSYQKGAYVLHMLRWVTGDSSFFQGLRNYLNDPQLAYNFATTPNLKTHLENTSGLNLTNFFDDWYYNQGYPSYNIHWIQTGNNFITKINQTQSHPSVSFFEMPVPLRLQGPGLDTVVVFDHTFSGEIFNATIAQTITQVTFDPDLWILSANNSVVKDISLSNSQVASQLLTFVVMPNPVADMMILDYVLPVAGDVLFTMSDAVGRTVFTNVYNTESAGKHTHKVNTEDFVAGTYFCTLSSGKYTMQNTIHIRK